MATATAIACEPAMAPITPGNVLIVAGLAGRAAWFPGATEHMAVDVMSGRFITQVFYNKAAAVVLKLKGPASCRFVPPGPSAPYPKDTSFEMWDTGTLSWTPFMMNATSIRFTMMAQPPPSLPLELNDNNSLSFWFGLVGRDGAALDFDVTVFATGNIAEGVRSCDWAVTGLDVGSPLGGRL